jgi:EAL domain-containing protein (putative c-di-GMP-specific phosphodiesterase class I)
MRVVAEGIETANELRCVLDYGCDYLQGFLLGKPEPDATPSSFEWGNVGVRGR